MSFQQPKTSPRLFPARQGEAASPAAIASVGLLTFFGSVQVGALLSFLVFDRLVGPFVAGIAGASVLAVVAWLAGHAAERTTVLVRAGATAVATIAISFVLAASVHDFSHDGQQYHQQAVLALAQGWNPLLGGEYAGRFELWINGYAKGTWLFAAAMQSVTGSVEIGKSMNLIVAAAAALAVYSLCRDAWAVPQGWAAALAVVSAANPVLASQWPTYYNDNLVGSLLLASGCFALRVAQRGLRDKIGWLGLAIALALPGTIKSSGLAYAILFAGIVFAAIAGLAEQRRAAMGQFLVVAALALSASALLLGFNPYVTNTVRHGHPLYPLAGSAAEVDILEGHVRPEFLEKSRPEKLMLSVLSRSHSTVVSEQRTPADQYRLKLPGTVDRSELNVFFNRTDVRIGGFGPLFSLVLCVGLAAWAVAVRTSGWFVLLVPGAIIVLTLAFPEPWWARYVPQFWLMPIAAAAVGWFARPRSGTAKGMLAAVLCIAMLNTGVVGGLFAAKTVSRELDFQEQIASLREISARSGPIRIKLATTESTAHRLKDAGLDFRLVPADAICEEPRTILYTDAVACVPRSELVAYREESRIVSQLKARFGR